MGTYPFAPPGPHEPTGGPWLFTGEQAGRLASIGIRPPAGLVDYTPRPRPPGKWRLRWRQLKAYCRDA